MKLKYIFLYVIRGKKSMGCVSDSMNGLETATISIEN
jgi:hypothetical protein